MTEWAGLSDMYVLIRSEYRYYLDIILSRYVSRAPRLGWKHRATLCRVVFTRITAVIYVDWELPDKFRGKGRPLVGRKSLIDDGRRRFRWGSR